MSNDIYSKLTAEFGPEALSADYSRGANNVLTSIKAHYVVERLNEVMGVNGWESSYEEHVLPGQGVTCKCKLTLHFPEKSVTKEAFGGASFVMKTKNGDKEKILGDVVKSAMTDALGKAASHFGVGNSVFKGLVEPNGKMKGVTAKPAASSTSNSKYNNLTKPISEANTTSGFKTKTAKKTATKTTKSKGLRRL